MRLGKKLPGLLWSCSSALGECAWGYTRRIFDRTAGFSVALWVKYVSTQSSLMIKRRMVPALLVICSIFFLFVDPHKWPEIIMNQYFYVFAAFFIFNTLPQNFYSSSKLQKPSQDKKKKTSVHNKGRGPYIYPVKLSRWKLFAKGTVYFKQLLYLSDTNCAKRPFSTIRAFNSKKESRITLDATPSPQRLWWASLYEGSIVGGLLCV